MITSLKNDQIRFIKSLSIRKNREENKCFFVEGLRGVCEGILAGTKVRQLVLSQTFVNSSFYRDLLAKTGSVEDFSPESVLLIVSDEVFKAISETETPQGVAAIFEIGETPKIEGDSVVLLENLQDPGNMGTVIRTADAAGFDAVVCTRGCVDVYNQKVIRSTAGSIFHIPVIQSGLSGADIADVLKSKGYVLYAAHPRGNVSCFDEPFVGKSCIVIGNEANGLTDNMIDKCDVLLTIPMPGKAESLNASVAAALLIYEKTRKKAKQ